MALSRYLLYQWKQLNWGDWEANGTTDRNGGSRTRWLVYLEGDELHLDEQSLLRCPGILLEEPSSNGRTILLEEPLKKQNL